MQTHFAAQRHRALAISDLRAALAAAALALAPGIGAAAFVDITSLTPGGVGTGAFSGTLDGVTISGSVVGGVAGFSATGTTFDTSTTDGTSPQFSFTSSYSPTQTLGDRLGYVQSPGSTDLLEIELVFDAPITDLVFHIASLDGSDLDFSPQGLVAGDIAIVESNGRLSLGTGPVVSGGTVVAFPPDQDPISSTSGYGSISLAGTFTGLKFNFSTTVAGDGGSIQLSGTAGPVPVPATLSLLAFGAVGMYLRRRVRHRPEPQA